MVDDDIETLLREALGLKITSIGASTVNRAIHRRMKALGILDKDQYWLTLRGSREEICQLTEEVVIPETWFFRDEKPFLAVQHFAKTRFSNDSEEGVLKVLSAPCSTGEEPYSLAIALLQANLPENRFQVHAVDISTRALNRARVAIYGDNSFRGGSLGFRGRYFEKSKSGYELHENVRKKVTFRQGNLLDPAFMMNLGMFDIIFCRNLLIYLEKDAQEQTIKTLGQMLVEDGLLFVGHAEAGVFRDSQFSPAALQAAFAFQKNKKKHAETDRNLSLPTVLPALSATSTVIPVGPHTDASGPNSPSFIANTIAVKDLSFTTDLELAQRLANEGRLMEAAGACEAVLRTQGPSAEVYFLLGVIRDAAGAPEDAMTLFRKAIYLKPDHQAGLVLLSLLTERLGDKAGAEALRRRAQRVKERDEAGS